MPIAGDEVPPNSRSSRSRVPQGSLATSTRDACSYVGTKLKAPFGQRIETRIRYYQVNRQLSRREQEGQANPLPSLTDRRLPMIVVSLLHQE
jgi:hypothetical protein